MKDTAAVPSWFLDSFCIINISLTSVLWRSRAVPFHSICTHFYAIWKCHIVRSLQCLASKFHSMSNECESSVPPLFMIYFLKREVLEQPSTRYSIFNICRYLKKNNNCDATLKLGCLPHPEVKIVRPDGGVPIYHPMLARLASYIHKLYRSDNCSLKVGGLCEIKGLNWRTVSKHFSPNKKAQHMYSY